MPSSKSGRTLSCERQVVACADCCSGSSIIAAIEVKGRGADSVNLFCRKIPIICSPDSHAKHNQLAYLHSFTVCPGLWQHRQVTCCEETNGRSPHSCKHPSEHLGNSSLGFENLHLLSLFYNLFYIPCYANYLYIGLQSGSHYVFMDVKSQPC